MLGKIEGKRKRGGAESQMVGWLHQLNGHEFEQTLGDGEGQESLACCSPWGCKESVMTEQLNSNITKNKKIYKGKKNLNGKSKYIVKAVDQPLK